MKAKKFGFELFVISMSVFALSHVAVADDSSEADKKAEKSAHVEASLGAGYSLGSGANLGGAASMSSAPKKITLDQDYNSLTLAKLQPKVAGNIQVNAADGSIQKGGVALSGFNITSAADFRRNGGEGFGIMQMLSPTLQYQRDNRLGLTELPRLDYFRTGLVTAPGGNGGMCGVMTPAWILAPNAVQALAIDGKARAGFSWNVDAFCHGDLGKKTGQLDVQAGAEVTLMTDENTMGKVYAGGKFKNIGGSPIYAGAEISHTGLEIDANHSRQVTDTGAFVGIAGF